MCPGPCTPRLLATGDGQPFSEEHEDAARHDQRTLLDGLQIPVANAGAELSRGVLQINA